MTSRINIVKMPPPYATQRFSAILIKILSQFFIYLERTILKLIWKNKTLRLIKTISNNKRTAGDIIIPDFKLYYRAVAIKST